MCINIDIAYIYACRYIGRCKRRKEEKLKVDGWKRT